TADTGELIAGGLIAVATASPGLFTLTKDGKGQGAILNQDGSPNGPANPAALGSVISLFGTGQGPTNPVVPDGQPAPSGDWRIQWQSRQRTWVLALPAPPWYARRSVRKMPRYNILDSPPAS